MRALTKLLLLLASVLARPDHREGRRSCLAPRPSQQLTPMLAASATGWVAGSERLLKTAPSQAVKSWIDALSFRNRKSSDGPDKATLSRRQSELARGFCRWAGFRRRACHGD